MWIRMQVSRTLLNLPACTERGSWFHIYTFGLLSHPIAAAPCINPVLEYHISIYPAPSSIPRSSFWRVDQRHVCIARLAYPASRRIPEEGEPTGAAAAFRLNAFPSSPAPPLLTAPPQRGLAPRWMNATTRYLTFLFPIDGLESRSSAVVGCAREERRGLHCFSPAYRAAKSRFLRVAPQTCHAVCLCLCTTCPFPL